MVPGQKLRASISHNRAFDPHRLIYHSIRDCSLCSADTSRVGQGVDLMRDNMSVRNVANEFSEGFIDASDRLMGPLEE